VMELMWITEMISWLAIIQLNNGSMVTYLNRSVRNF